MQPGRDDDDLRPHVHDDRTSSGTPTTATAARRPRAFPGLADDAGAVQTSPTARTWHFFFGWVLTLAIVVYIVTAAVRKDLRELVLRPSDLPKLWPMQLYYLRLRKEPPPHGTYNPLQKAAYTVVLFVFIPLIILTGLGALAGRRRDRRPADVGLRRPAVRAALALHADGRFSSCTSSSTWSWCFRPAPWNNIKSMITGWYRLGDHDGVGV